MTTIEWTEDDVERTALWRSESATPPPRKVVVADDRTRADDAYRLACEGTALLWRGDFHNARQLLAAMARRIDRRPAKAVSDDPAQTFHRHRAAQNHRARILGMLLVPLAPDGTVPLSRAPDVREVIGQSYGDTTTESVVALRELLGLIGAYEWRKKGVAIPALDGDRIFPSYGVFSPARGEYIDLVGQEDLPSTDLAFDIGTGTGVLAAVLVKRGIPRVIATDQDVRALDCARENLARLGFADRVDVIEADLFPPGRSGLVVCNPPWLPAKPTSPVEFAVYDPGSRMLLGFLDGLSEHLTEGGEGWLILSDLAEHLGLRTRDQLLAMFAAAGLSVLGRSDIAPRHRKSRDTSDPLHAARAAEITSLWRLGV
ncbi:methyltransferase [Antrihabitans cavernicola]|uniref:Class I SAM-dependent methyltransferase n=1 Tax=Antrihabitans cavernicola TaxID=2495913 RepID=A0A5A7SEZ6_9NOCA|nr:class I SAM-dependent methyltransferase [Spelaeibacter cavernicola]KAA0023732.1 class I SAM-dependent methyltransferase [Spelaeibacter cavernicola]